MRILSFQMRAILLDCQPRGRMLGLWLKTPQGVREYFVEYRPRIYVMCEDLEATAHVLSSRGFICERILVRDLISNQFQEALSVGLMGCEGLSRYVRLIEQMGGYRWRLFNADLGADQMFLYERNLRPLSWVEFELEGDVVKDIRALDLCEDPGLKVVEVRVEAEYSPLRDFDCGIKRLRLGEHAFEGEEERILADFKAEYLRQDPDVVLVEDGDKYAVEYILYRFQKHMSGFAFGRREQDFKSRAGKSYFSYGHVVRRNPSHYLIGRFHIDSSSFMYREAGLGGIFELARLTFLPVQKVARLSPGASISNLYVATAYQRGYPIPYKWNMVEDFKTARQLLEADKGGFIYEPRVGFHTGVVELDFVSLYPHIMVNYNISPETVLCGCCPGKNIVPYAGYNICEKRQGLVPNVVKPLIERRIRYKRLYQETKDERYKAMADALKWVLVTSFGYTGYKRSRFARIEAHESITSHARRILQETASMAEAHGFEVLHGIVDSLWVRKDGVTEDDIGRLVRDVEARFRIPLKCEGKYRWIVFLPSVANPMAPVPNRYYGVFDWGEIKVRGIELRRGDSPKIVKDFQMRVLESVADAPDEASFRARLPSSLGVLREYRQRLLAGGFDRGELAVTRRISRRRYRGNSPQKAVSESLARNGVAVHPGEYVEYVIRDSLAANPMHRYVPKCYPLDRRVDVEKYTELLAKSLEGLFLPFGWDLQRIVSGMDGTSQTRLQY
jgi:DNA polymerase elongation subunit (family B)